MLKQIAAGLLISTGAAYAACPVVDSHDWTADLSPASDGGYTLTLRGTVDLPTPGHTIRWQEGPMDLAMPPGWRLIMEIDPPEGIAMQVITPTEIEARFETPINWFRVIYVVCDREGLAEIGDVRAVSPD